VLLRWEHSGFSVHAGAAIEPKAVERVSRYLTRAPLALGKVNPQKDGRIKLLTPRDPTTGLDHRLFDPLAWVHAVTTQIPDARQHMGRCYGPWGEAACARCTWNPKPAELGGTGRAQPLQPPTSRSPRRLP
jgi:hypothetical protein